MVERYTIFLCGFGRRAQDHLAANSTSGRFDVVGICDTAVTAREAANRCGHMAVSQLADGLVRTQLCPFRGHPPVPLAYLIDATGKRRVSCQVDTERMQVSAHFETKKLESPAWLIFIVSRWWEASRVGKDGRALGWAINRFGLRQSSDLFADKQHEPGPRPDSLDSRLIDGVFNAMPTGRDQ